MEWVQFRTLTFRFRHKFVKLSAAKLSPFLAARFAASKSPTNSPKKSQPSNMSIEGSPPVVVPAKEKQNGTVIFFHGLGDQGDGWASMFRDEIRIKTTKFICPNAADRPVTLNFGMSMPAWFDLKGLSQDAEEDEQGIAAATEYVHNLVEQEIAAGVPAEKIILGGFSMGGALAIYAGLTCKHKLAGIVGLSSFLLQRTKLPGSHTANLQTKILLGHGSNDFLVPLTFGQMTQAAIKEFNPNVELKVYPGMQHSSCPQEMSDVKKFIEKVLK
ncbi:hypothetical protein QR680_008430 [Steinernema hermaphroditum]|uniref:palmitoyl-protein hydrolase n=1 Tax=Steinernema hermaphroditum TaxID=289476 RepID=A0AA39IHX1_9BILA|nr:hypothetical protein QR680_008430 [Steinernema hermaphroditum]